MKYKELQAAAEVMEKELGIELQRNAKKVDLLDECLNALPKEPEVAVATDVPKTADVKPVKEMPDTPLPPEKVQKHPKKPINVKVVMGEIRNRIRGQPMSGSRHYQAQVKAEVLKSMGITEAEFKEAVKSEKGK